MPKIQLISLFIFSIVASGSFAQSTDWSDKIHDRDLTFDEIVQLHRDAWPSRPSERGQGFKQLERFISLHQSRLNEQGKIISGAETIRTWEEIRAFNQSRSLAGNWFSLGPIIDEVTSHDMIEGVGRMQAIAFHPQNNQYMLAGAPAGGIWRSFDGGQTWSTNTDFLPTLGVSAIAFDPSDPQIVYAGTGDRDAADAPGMGVLKSTDGGETWEFFNTGIENTTVGCIRFQPGTGHVFAGTDDGIYKSSDGGITWVQVSQNTATYKDFEFHPNNGQIIYSTSSGKFLRSENGGEDWDWIVEEIGNSSRMCIAVTPLEPDVVYVIKATTYSFAGFYKSTDTGLTFTEMSTTPNILGWAADGSSTGGQAWYDLCLEADREVPGVVYVGGIRMKKSTDSGVTWEDINPNYLHVDQHELEFNPHNNDLYVCNDGGLYHYAENQDWLDISAGIVTGQIYQLAQSPHNPNHTLCGFQDNGTMEFDGVYWRRRGGGDGFECAYDFTEENRRYGSIYYGDIYRTTPTVVNQKICGMDVLDINEEGPWNTPYKLSEHDTTSGTMFVGLKNVWRSVNIKDPERDSINWVKISNNLGTNSININEIEISCVDPNLMYAAKDNKKLYRCNNAMSENPTWVTLNNFLPIAQAPVNGIETNPIDTNIVYICYNSNVYRSSDQGLTWVNLSESLPDVVTNCIVLDRTDPGLEALYVGTDMGIYYRDTMLGEFIPFNDGFPFSSRVTELEIYYGEVPSQNRLKASTYGRGLWESDLYSAQNISFPAVAAITNSDNTNEVFGEFSTDIIFYKSLNEAAVTGFDNVATDIMAINANILSISGGPSNYTALVQPLNYGEVKLYIPNGAATDEFGNSTYMSDTLKVVYVEAPQPLGPFGPGGIGDDNSLTFWLRADREVQAFGETAASWGDIGNSGYAATQNEPDRRPVLNNNGINGYPAMEFDGENDVLQLNDVIPGRSISAFIMVETDSIKFNDHGWFASSRVPNGYLMHPWKNDFYYHNEVLDLDQEYSGTNSFYIGDASAPHIYGFVYHQDDLHQVMNTIFDDDRYPQPGVNLGLRDNTTPIDIDLGHDYGYDNDRFGKGLIAEHFLFGVRLMETHINIVNNYLASRYGIDLGPDRLYHHHEQNNDVIGIGRETAYDFHDDARGLNIIRIKNPSSLDDDDYLLIGNDNASMTLVNNAFPFLSSRVERTWGFNETGDLGQVTVRIEASDLPDTQDIGLIITEDESFVPGSQVTFVPLLIQGPVLEATVDFPASGVFTIGKSPLLGVYPNEMVSAIVFPNPANDFLQIRLKNAYPENWITQLYDVTGKLVKTAQHTGNSAILNMQDLHTGIYHVEILVNDEVIGRTKVMKQVQP
jgi:photosystem II stability/assembly factor-like uncharacterized protein